MAPERQCPRRNGDASPAASRSASRSPNPSPSRRSRILRSGGSRPCASPSRCVRRSQGFWDDREAVLRSDRRYPWSAMSSEELVARDPVVIDVTDSDFTHVVVKSSNRRRVVVDFWATWCQPCRVLSPVLERLAAEKGGAFLLAKLDVDANQYAASQFRV